MLVKYNGFVYEYDEYSGKIRTTDKTKTDNSFDLKSRMYYKEISPSELTDIFRSWVYVVYDTGIEGLEKEWHICGEYGLELHAGISDDSVTIVCSGRHIPEWESSPGSDYTDAVNSTLTIMKTDLEGAGLEYSYSKKDGKEYDPPLIEKTPIEVNEINKYFDYFRFQI